LFGWPGSNEFFGEGALSHREEHSPVYQVHRFAIGELDCLSAEGTCGYYESLGHPFVAQNAKDLLHRGSRHLAFRVVFALDDSTPPVLP